MREESHLWEDDLLREEGRLGEEGRLREDGRLREEGRLKEEGRLQGCYWKSCFQWTKILTLMSYGLKREGRGEVETWGF